MDQEIRQLEREALQGNSDSLERLKTAWARSVTWRQCWLCESKVPAFASSWKDHGEACPLALQQKRKDEEVTRQQRDYERRVSLDREYVEAPANQFTSQGNRVRLVPYTGAVAGRARKEPIWLRSTDGFKTIRSNAALTGGWAYLPPGQVFFWYKCSLLPDITTPKKDLEKLFNEGQLAFQHQTSTLLTLPCSTIMVKPGSYWLEEIEDIPRTDVTISDKPLELQAQEMFKVNLNMDIYFPLVFVLYGIWVRPITS